MGADSVIGVGATRWKLAGSELAAVPPSAVVMRVRGATVVTSDGKTRLDAIDLAVGRGEMIAVVGSSGAGKSTLLGAITGTGR